MRTAVRLLHRTALRIRAQGLRAITREVVRRISRPAYTVAPAIDPFDQAHGTDTGGTVHLWRLDIPSRDALYGVHYESSLEVDIRRALDPIPREATLVDLGCGKGRVLLIAAQMEFRRLIGVEFSADLLRIAARNLQLMNVEAELVCQSAAEFVFPDGPLGIYMCNPFGLEVMRPVVAHLRARTEDTWVTYLNPNLKPGCRQLIEQAFGAAQEMPGTCLWTPQKVARGVG